MADDSGKSPHFPQTEHPQQAVPELDQQQDERQRQRRRRLLKGLAAGVPAIVTLKSGAALAATSTTCAINNYTVPASGLSGGIGPRCSTAVPTPGTAAAKYKFYEEQSSYFNADISGNANYNTGGGTAGDYCAVYVTNNGNNATNTTAGGLTNPNAQPDNASGYYLVTISCWTSFH